MSNVLVDKEKIDILANAISDKSGESIPMTLAEMVEAVDGIGTGGGIIPTGNIDITQAGVTDVTNYATATVPDTIVINDGINGSFVTVNGVREWHAVPWFNYLRNGMVNEGLNYGGNTIYNAVPSNTTITPTESAQTIGGANYMMEGAVTVNAIPSNYVGSGITQRSSSDLTASGATVTVPSGYYSAQASKAVASGSVTVPSTITATGATRAYNKSQGYMELSKTVSVTPTVTTEGYISSGTAGDVTITLRKSENIRDETDVTVSDATVSIPAGLYPSSVTKTVASGTAGTPTATKGTVSNHSVSVTPSVTNTTGYISGGTINGTAVTVTASELASGNKAITENGTDIDVIGYSTVSVNVSGGTSVQTKTGTFTGSNGISVDISCNFAPDLIYVYGNLSGSTNNRGVISITIVKDTMILQTSDTSSSSANESASYFASSGVSGYVGSSSYCHATYSNSTLTITTGANTSANRFTSGITYSYELLKWTT